MRNFVLLCGVALLCAVLVREPVRQKESVPEPAQHPVARGTFIQEYLVRDWTDDQWQAEFRALREVGMEYLVFGSTADSKEHVTYYPTRIPGYRLAPGYGDTIEACLRNAKKANFKVFVGLNFHADWWKKSARDAPWLLQQMEDGNAIAKELWERYGRNYPTTFYGWYWVWEVDNLNFRTPEHIATLTKALDTNVRYLKTLTPDKPVMLCPFMNYRLGKPESYQKMWETVFAESALGKGDIFCPQDCVGAGGLTMGNYKEWFAALKKAVATKPGLRFWVDTETFTQEDWTSATVGRYVQQMKDIQPYVENIITFAYSHYYSPNTVGGGFHRTYAEYVRTGKLETTAPPAPTNFQATRTDSGKVRLQWHTPANKSDICGYYVYRDGTLISRKQIGKNKVLDTSETLEVVDEKPGADPQTVRYILQSYDYAGNVSPRSEATVSGE